MNKGIIAHELGHALAANTQDRFWYPTSIVLEKDDNALAYCYCDQLEEKKSHVTGPYTKFKQMMNLGGIFGELICNGHWSPWGGRADIDEFVTANCKSSSPFVEELDDWLFVDDDDFSFRACSALKDRSLRRSFLMTHVDTFQRLPELWGAYVDFCDRIRVEAFIEAVDDIAKSKERMINGNKLAAIAKDIIE